MKIGRNAPCPCGSGRKFKQCCIAKPEYHLGGDPLKTLIAEGYRLLDADEEARAAIVWLDAWGQLSDVVVTSAIRSASSLDQVVASRGLSAIDNWIQDLEDLLGNLSMTDDAWAERRLQYVHDVYTRLPESHPEMIFNLQRDEAEALFLVGRSDDGDRAFEAIIAANPDNEWSYIGWGDMYSPVFFRDKLPADVEKARAIYERGLTAMGPESEEEKIELARRITIMG